MIKIIFMWALCVSPDGTLTWLKTDKGFENMRSCEKFVDAENSAIDTAMLGGVFRNLIDSSGEMVSVIHLECRGEGFRT